MPSSGQKVRGSQRSESAPDHAGGDDEPHEIAAGRADQSARARGSLRVDRGNEADKQIGDDAQGAEPGAEDETGEQHEQHLQGKRHRAEHRHGHEGSDEISAANSAARARSRVEREECNCQLAEFTGELTI